MNCTKQEFETIVKICERAEELNIAPNERFTLIKDLENTHKTIGLNLEALLKADDFNFSHDIVGIRTHMNRETQELEGFFVPRYALQKNVDINSLIDDAQTRAGEQMDPSVPVKSDVAKDFE